MDAASFAVGLAGLATFFEAVCEVWRAVRTASGFGAEIVDSIRRLEMEFFRFHTWWSVLQTLELRESSLGSPRLPAVPKTPTIMKHFTLQNPIINAAESILSALKSVEELLRMQGVLDTLDSRPARSMTMPNRSSGTLAALTGAAQREKRDLERDLMASVSWQKRVKYNATPWRQSNKDMLATLLSSLSYWNDSLYEILPSGIRDSVLRQGISGYLLINNEESIPWASLQGGMVSQQARFNQVYSRLLDTSFTDAGIRERLLPNDRFNLPSVSHSNKFAFAEYNEGGGAVPETVLVEWYSLPDGSMDASKLVRERLAKMSLLLSRENRPGTLYALDCLGCVESPPSQSQRHFGLVSRLPLHTPGIQESLISCGIERPMTLHEMLRREKIPGTNSHASLPTLPKRFYLAASLAQTLYTFMLADWHHKLFNSQNVVFLPVTTSKSCTVATTSTSEPNEALTATKTPGPFDITSPLICGFSIARPSAPEEVSVSGFTPLSEMYLHPDLRVSPPRKRPRYSTKYELYSFGLLLAEIGFWQPVTRIAAVNSSSSRQATPTPEKTPKQFSETVYQKCEKDLACWMGEEYAAVTLQCLEAKQGSPLTREKMVFYWRVVWQLDQCADRMKLFTANEA